MQRLLFGWTASPTVLIRCVAHKVDVGLSILQVDPFLFRRLSLGVGLLRLWQEYRGFDGL